jgi:hypothetical protein
MCKLAETFILCHQESAEYCWLPHTLNIGLPFKDAPAIQQQWNDALESATSSAEHEVITMF